MSPRPPRSAIACLTAGLLASAPLHADQDAPPVDVGLLLKQLQNLQQQQVTQLKTSRLGAIQKISAAASNTAAGIELWEEAVRATQMEGAGKEAQQFRAWKETEGELFKEKEVQNAVHLHLEWLALTLQRANGTAVKDLLTPVVNYTRELIADQAWMDALDDAIQKEKQAPGPPKLRNQKAKDDTAVRKTHDSILRGNLNGSIIVQWLKLGDVGTDKWEMNPNNLDGIYRNIVLPELRAQKDSRVFDYWDMKLKKEADAASKSKLNFEVDKFNSLRRPALLWSRAQEYTFLGQKNRAATLMFDLIKTFPAHPDVPDWIAALEALLAPPPTSPPEAPATSAAPPAPAAPAVTAAPAAPGLPPGAPLPVSPPTSSLPGAQ